MFVHVCVCTCLCVYECVRVCVCGCVGVRVGEVGAEADDPLKFRVSLELFQRLTGNSRVDEFFHERWKGNSGLYVQFVTDFGFWICFRFAGWCEGVSAMQTSHGGRRSNETPRHLPLCACVAVLKDWTIYELQCPHGPFHKCAERPSFLQYVDFFHSACPLWIILETRSCGETLLGCCINRDCLLTSIQCRHLFAFQYLRATAF
mmetsp:Transcript_20463/g.30026  ORF Transcript_20463/g.30026 Transcript_20463/m.30026 type:complete len:204 (+) Transcript_20463:181-792(+)